MQEVEVHTSQMEFNNRRFDVYFYVNGENTYTLKNVHYTQVWDESIPSEALRPDPGNRWHVLMKQAAIQDMRELDLGNSFPVAYQEYLEGYDNEMIYIIRTK